MPKLSILTGKELVKILKKMGFKEIRQRGSHVFMEHEDGRITIVPIHSGENIGKGLLNKIIKEDLKITVEEFIKILKGY